MSPPASSGLTPGGFLKIEKGALASFNARACRIRRVLAVDSVLIEYIETGETQRVAPTDLCPISAAKQEEPSKPKEKAAEKEGDEAGNTTDINGYSTDEWDQAKALFAVIKPLIEMGNRKREDVEKVAKAKGVNVSTVYGWIKAYEETGHLSGLVYDKRGRKQGKSYLAPEQDAIIEMVLNPDPDQKRDDNSPPLQTVGALVQKIKDAFDEASVKQPHDNTLRDRIKKIPLYEQIRRRGNKDKAKQLSEARPGTFPDATHPLACIQVDHVELNRHVVDEQTREPIATRPWLTLAIDVYTRMIVGYFLSLMRPNAFAAGVCIFMAIMDKKELLAKLNLPGRWPVFGKMRKVHMDNAKEFKGHLLQRGFDEHNIDLQLRPLKRPHYGGHIERMVGNVNRELEKKAGTTFRSPEIAPDYDSMKEAIHTMAETEKDIVDWIVNVYSVKGHTQLNKMPPLRKWELGIMGDKNNPGIGMPEIPADPEKLRLDFMPFEKRAVNTYGVEIDVRLYYHECLNGWINALDPVAAVRNPKAKKKRKFIFRYDPRSIRRIWFWDPDLKKYFEIPISNKEWPDISWSEADANRRAMEAEGLKHVDEDAQIGYWKRSKIREAESLEKTKGARKAKSRENADQKRTNTAPGAEHYAAAPVSPEKPQALPPVSNVDDLFSEDVQPFEDSGT